MEFESPYLSTIIAGLLAVLLISLYIVRRSGQRKKSPRAPEAGGGWPLIGHLPLLGGPQLPHITLGALADKYGPVFTIRVGVHRTLVISSWEVAKECYTTHDVSVSSRPKLLAAEIMGHNYANFGFCRYGDFWRDMRKLSASELLSNRKVEQLSHIRLSEIKSSLKQLYKQWNKNKNNSEELPVELKTWVGDINLNVILKMVCGKRYSGSSDGGGDDEKVRSIRKTMREFFRLTGQFLVGDALPYLRWLDIGRHEKAMKETAKELEVLVEEWLDEHRRKRDSDSSAGDQDFMGALLSKLDGIDLAGFDADTVNKATCLTIISGGTDTVTVTITWLLALLLNNSEALKKTKEELDANIGLERMVEESDISKLVYLQAVVKETLRLYPPGPLSGPREFSEDCTVGGYHIPAGTRLMTNLWKIQTDPRIWSDPLEFKPERFLTTHREVDVRGQNFELIPFGGGRRACPGVGFAILMMQLMVAGLIHGFEITTPLTGPVDMRASFGLTNIKAGPFEVLLKPRLFPSAYE